MDMLLLLVVFEFIAEAPAVSDAYGNILFRMLFQVCLCTVCALTRCESFDEFYVWKIFAWAKLKQHCEAKKR